MKGMSCRIVLVRPRNPNNIGAAARAMKNFGFDELFVVAPYAPVWEEVVSAVQAEDLIGRARVVAELAEAVADCTLVVGTGDPRRTAGQPTLYTPAQLSEGLAGAAHKLALVFGPEKHGLTNDDLSYCHRLLSIPTRPDCPSMNLGQAVAVCCYELARGGASEAVTRTQAALPAAGEVEAALKLLLAVLRLAEFIKPGGEPALARKLRQALLHLDLTRPDLKVLCGALYQISGKLQTASHQPS